MLTQYGSANGLVYDFTSFLDTDDKKIPIVESFIYGSTQTNIQISGLTISHNNLTHTFNITYNRACTRYTKNGASQHFNAGQSEQITNAYELAYWWYQSGTFVKNPNAYYVVFDCRWVAIIGRKADSSTVTLFHSVTDTNIHTFTGMSDYVEVVIHNNNAGTADANTISVRLYD